jgi:hypothetical protein
VRGERRKIRNEEFCSLYSLPSTNKTIKSRKIKWDGHLVRIEEKRGTQGKENTWKTLTKMANNIKLDLKDIG